MEQTQLTLPTPPLAKTSLVADERVNLAVPESLFNELITVLARRLRKPLQREQLEDVWCCLVFALIVWGGVCGNEAFDAICAMRLCDLLICVDGGYVRVPRLNGTIPVYVCDLVKLAVLQLIAHLSRNGHGGRNRSAPYPVEAYLLPGRPDPLARPAREEIDLNREQFEEWLKSMVKAITADGPVINLRRLLVV